MFLVWTSLKLAFVNVTGAFSFHEPVTYNRWQRALNKNNLLLGDMITLANFAYITCRSTNPAMDSCKEASGAWTEPWSRYWSKDFIFAVDLIEKELTWLRWRHLEDRLRSNRREAFRAEMMRSRTETAFSPVKESPAAAADWEVRPGGMLVQTRGVDACPPAPTIRVKVKHGVACHEIYIGAQTSFGELKKVLSAKTGLHPLDMKLSYKNRERPSTAFLDSAGVKDKSKLLLEEDPAARAKRLLDMRKADKAEKTAKSISAISLEVDHLGSKVSEMEAMVNQNRKVVDKDVTDLIESLMNELVKLDAIVADGDVNVQRRLQIKTAQRYVETLDFIKFKNTQLSEHHSPSNQMLQKRDLQQPHNPFQQQNQQQRKQETAEFYQQTQLPVVMTMNWETFDSLFTPSTSSAATTASSTPHASFDWEQF